MNNYKISLASRYYDRTDAIIRGLVKPPDVDLKVDHIDHVKTIFTRMFRGEFDVSEFSFAEFVYYTSRNKCDFIAIPVFPAKVFRHGYIFSNSKIERPEQLDGKNLGFIEWVQSAAVWIRGTLMEEYNISPKNTGWYISQVHHWETSGEEAEIKPNNGSVVQCFENDGNDIYARADSALVQGKIAALGMASNTKSFVRGDKRVKRLFENRRDVESSYFKKTRIFPIMHILVARKSVVEEHPDLPQKLFELYVQSKRIAQTNLKKEGSIVWKNQYLDEEEKIFQGDPFAYGLEKNAHIIEKFLSYCYDQGVSARRMNARDLFVPSTCDLTEESIPAQG